jgi:galactokinase
VDISKSISLFASLVAVIVSVFGIYRSIKFVPHEERSMDATTVKTLMEASAIAATQATETFRRCDELEERVDILQDAARTNKQMISELTEKNNALMRENEKLKEEIKYVHTENLRLVQKVAKLEAQLIEYGKGRE